MQLKVVIGSDHAGFECKQNIKNEFLNSKIISFTDEGTFTSESVDYPDFAHKVAEKISNNSYEYGVLICGSGNGVCITANKHHNVRAALCWTVELAELARKHNNANILCIPARFITIDVAIAMVKLFMTTSFEAGRHEIRTEKIELN